VSRWHIIHPRIAGCINTPRWRIDSGTEKNALKTPPTITTNNHDPKRFRSICSCSRTVRRHKEIKKMITKRSEEKSCGVRCLQFRPTRLKLMRLKFTFVRFIKNETDRDPTTNFRAASPSIFLFCSGFVSRRTIREEFQINHPKLLSFWHVKLPPSGFIIRSAAAAFCNISLFSGRDKPRRGLILILFFLPCRTS
jgi:hypothetical protein